MNRPKLHCETLVEDGTEAQPMEHFTLTEHALVEIAGALADISESLRHLANHFNDRV
jgi:hypothetical protein